MPIYEYQCPKCGQFEMMRKFSDPPLKKCPTCKKAVKKLISNTSFQLKGSGWYVTDYARKSSDSGKSESTKSDSSKKDSTTKSEASKSETSKGEKSTSSKSSDTKASAAA